MAPKEPYNDKVTGKLTPPVTTGQIYWGAVPFVIIQCIMVGLVIAFPQMVMHYKSVAPTIDPSKIEIRVPVFPGGLPGGLGAPGAPNFGPPPSFGPAPGAPPGLQLPPMAPSVPATPAPAAPAPSPTSMPVAPTPVPAPVAPSTPALPPPGGMIDVTKPPASLQQLAPKP